MSAQIAQLVEQRTENPRVSGSIPELGTNRRGLSLLRQPLNFLKTIFISIGFYPLSKMVCKTLALNGVL